MGGGSGNTFVAGLDALRMAADTLSLDLCVDPALDLVSRFPVSVSAHQRLLRGEEPVPPDPHLGHAANYLYMLRGEEPSQGSVRALETYLNTVSDHGMNASTFAARVVVATRSDLVS